MNTAQTKQLAGKNALITGAGTGIGREIAIQFARAGADVVLHYSHDSDDYRTALDEIEALGVRAIAIQARFEDLAQVRRLADEALRFLGGLDMLINNAGITMTWPFERVTPEQFDLLYQVNVRGPFFLTQHCAPALSSTRGTIVNIGSIHGLRGAPEHSVYAGTKGAVESFSRELAIELGIKGVRVNTIAPGCVVTDNYFKLTPDLDVAALGRNIPCGFAGEPGDIAQVAAFLCSDAARFIAGQTLVVDGGTTAWLPFSDSFRETGRTRMGKQYVPGME